MAYSRTVMGVGFKDSPLILRRRRLFRRRLEGCDLGTTPLFLLALGFILTVVTSLASAATLRVGDATAQVGGTARVAVNLDNLEDNVRALQFSLGALPAGVEFGDAAATGRAAALTAEAERQPDGTVQVVLISLGAQTVAAGSGPVLDLYFAVNEAGSTNVALMPTEVRVAGTAGALDATGQAGQLNVEGGSAAPPPAAAVRSMRPAPGSLCGSRWCLRLRG